MYYYKATVQYVGTNYAGFQWQTDLRTVQDEINQAIKKCVDGKATTMGASRTDTGVHAFRQVVKFTLENEIECASFFEKFNKALPSDVKCLELVPSVGLFRPANDSTLKEYRYFFTNIHKSQDTNQKYYANNPFELDIEKMKSCIRLIIGTHDFCNFCSTGSNVKTTIRNVTFCELNEIDPHTVFSNSDLFQMPEELKTCYQLRIEANGFLKQMIRHLVSALWKVGNGRMSVEEFKKLVDGPKIEKRLWKVATPKGLYLYRIEY